MKNIFLRNQFSVAILVILLASCTTIEPFNQKAYEQTTSLKVDALTTMDKATHPFSSERQSIESLKLNIEKAYEYAKGRPKNAEVVKQWIIIRDPSRNSLGGFIKRWKEQEINNGKGLSPIFIQEAKGIVSDGFDEIIELESGKIKPNNTPK